MPCFRPLTGFRSRVINPATGKRGIVFSLDQALPLDQGGEQLDIPCGQCIGCRLEHSRQWAMRCVHEALLHPNNSFITLTYRPEALEGRQNPWTLVRKDFQDFMKRLRKKFVPKNPYDKTTQKEDFDLWQRENGIRYYMCGEYGEICGDCLLSRPYCDCGPTDQHNWDKRKVAGRPHYHAILFNFDFTDKELFKITNTGDRLYTSAALEACWSHGNCSIGNCTFESAAYVARYCMKKVTGADQEEHYQRIIKQTGEFYPLLPEYSDMSRRPGIAKWFYDEYKSDLYPKDFITLDGKKMNPAKYYDRLLEKDDPELLDKLKQQRKLNAIDRLEHNPFTTYHTERMAVREEHKTLTLNRLIRPLTDA